MNTGLGAEISANLEQNSGLLIILIICMEVTAFYDPVKRKEERKLPLLGKITQSDGFIPSAKKSLKDKASAGVDISKISVRECGFF